MKEALNQINEKKYAKRLEYKNYNNIVKQVWRFGKMQKWGLKRSKREMWQELDERPAILERKFCENSKKLL